MVIVDKKLSIFKLKEIHFSDYPYDVEGCDVVSFPSCKNRVDAEGFTCVESLTSVIDLTQDLDTLWQNMNRKSARYWIRRAQRDGVKINISQNYEEFYRMNKSFEKQKGFAPLLGIGTTNLETMKRYGILFIAEHNGEMLSGDVYLEDAANLKAWVGSSKRLEVDREKAILIGRANRLLQWEAIKYAKEKGIRELDLGGLWPEQEADKDERKKAINSFKLNFGGEMATRYSYQKVYSPLYKLAQYLYALASHRFVKTEKSS